MKRFCISLCILFLINHVTPVSAKRNPTKKNPKNVILMIGDGMGLAQIHAAMSVNVSNLNMLMFPATGFIKTQSADNYITDSSASASAFSTGVKIKNGLMASDSLGNKLKTILEYAEENGLSTGLIATSIITHATPACFIAHQPSRDMMDEIALDFLQTDIDVFIGGGLKYFSKRSDSLNLLDSLRKKNYQVYKNIYDIKETDQKIAVFTADNHNPKISEGRGNMLPDATKKALNTLSKNKKGFFIMIEGSQIDWGGHNNDQEYVINELLDFDKAVGIAKNFAEKNKETLVIVTADHETGGMTVINGDFTNSEVTCAFATTKHTGIMVPVFAFGPGSSNFTGVYDNTEIFHKIKKLLNLK